MVLRRSTTDWAWATPLSNALRSMLIFMSHPSDKPGGAGYPFSPSAQGFFKVFRCSEAAVKCSVVNGKGRGEGSSVCGARDEEFLEGHEEQDFLAR